MFFYPADFTFVMNPDGSIQVIEIDACDQTSLPGVFATGACATSRHGSGVNFG